MESFFKNEFFSENDTADEWITSGSTTRSTRSSSSGGVEGDNRDETILSPSKHGHNRSGRSFEHRNRIDEDNITTETTTSFPSTFEIGDMAESDHHSLNTENTPLDKQERRGRLILASESSEADTSINTIKQLEASFSNMLHDVNDWIVRSPPSTPVITEAAIRSRQKKRMLEDQLKKWRNSSSPNPIKESDNSNNSSAHKKYMRRNRRRRHSIGSEIIDDDGPPPLIDCDEDDAERRNGHDGKGTSGGSQRIESSNVAKTQMGWGDKDTGSPKAMENSDWIPSSLGKHQHRRASTGHYPESSSDGFELVEPSLFTATEPDVFRPRNESNPHRQQKQDEQAFEKTNESFDNTWDDWPEMSITSDVSSTANKSESSRLRNESAISCAPGANDNEFGSSPISAPINSLPSKSTQQVTGDQNVTDRQFDTKFFAVTGRRASMGSIVSKDQSENPKRTPRRSSLSTIDGGLFLSPPRPSSLATRLGAMGAGGYSPTGQLISPGKNGARRPSFGSGSVTSARTGYSTNSGCDASRSSLGSSKASVSSSDVGRVVLIRGVVRESSRSSLGSKGVQSISDASRASSMGSVRTGGSEVTVKSGVSLSSGGRKSVSSVSSTGSPKSVLIKEGSRLKKALTLESIRSSVREAYRAPVSPASARLRMGNKMHPNDDCKARQNPSSRIRSPGSTDGSMERVSDELGSKVRSPNIDACGEENSTSESHLLSPLSIRSRRARSRSKGELGNRRERRGINSSDGDTDSGDMLGRCYQSNERTEEVPPKKSKRKGQQRSDKRHRRGSLDALVGSLSPRYRSNRENKNSRSSRRKDSRRHSRDGSGNAHDTVSDHKERCTMLNGTRRRNSLEMNPVGDFSHESHRRFMRRASTGNR